MNPPNHYQLWICLLLSLILIAILRNGKDNVLQDHAPFKEQFWQNVSHLLVCEGHHMWGFVVEGWHISLLSKWFHLDNQFVCEFLMSRALTWFFWGKINIIPSASSIVDLLMLSIDLIRQTLAIGQSITVVHQCLLVFLQGCKSN